MGIVACVELSLATVTVALSLALTFVAVIARGDDHATVLDTGWDPLRDDANLCLCKAAVAIGALPRSSFRRMKSFDTLTEALLEMVVVFL